MLLLICVHTDRHVQESCLEPPTSVLLPHNSISLYTARSFSFAQHSLYFIQKTALPVQHISTNQVQQQPTPPYYVRYTGMVQDMMETEYFTTTTQHRNTIHHSNLSERYPIVLMAIPPFQRYNPFRNTNDNENQDETQDPCDEKRTNIASSYHPLKRMRYETDHTTLQPSITQNTHQQQHENKSVPALPAKVLANFYFDQYPKMYNDNHATIDTTTSEDEQHDSMLQLNQMVEIVGIIDNESITDDTLDSSPMEMEENDGMYCYPLHSSDEWNMTDSTNGNVSIDATAAAAAATQNNDVKPLSRVHVLYYRIVDLENDDGDENINKNQDNPTLPTTSTFDKSPAVAPYRSLLSIWKDIRLGSTINTSLHESHDNYWDVVSQALWMTLNSKAEQATKPTRNTAIDVVRPALGCASLNIVLPHRTDVGNHQNDCIVSFLILTVQALVQPHCCHVIKLNDSNINSKNETASTLQHVLKSPQKLFGRMQSSALQLPSGSTLIVDVRSMMGNNDPSMDANDMKPNYDNPNHTLYAIRQVCRYFQLSYRFDGGVEIPFLADYRVIVVSDTTTQHLVPCTITIPPIHVPGPSSIVKATASTNSKSFSLIQKHSDKFDASMLAPLRDRLRKCRSYSTTTTVMRLQDAVIERAQQDFCHRRRQQYENQKYDPMSSSTSSSAAASSLLTFPTPEKRRIDEEDFHRWLTICRIHARCRGVTCAELVDWDYALVLEDAMEKLRTVDE
jgi:Mini-chromosome maintenance replisome factor